MSIHELLCVALHQLNLFGLWITLPWEFYLNFYILFHSSFTLSQWRQNEFESGGTGPEHSAGKNFLVVPLHNFGHKSRPTIGRFGQRFRDGQYSLVSSLFAVLLLTVPPCPMESAPLH